jgi:protein-S-isoprenylcysteine O-methyltransferase Ste14
MNPNTAMKPSDDKPEVTGAIRRRMVQVLFTYFFLASILVVSAGTLDWPAAWAYLGVYLGILVLNALVVLPRQPEMVAERGEIKEDVKGWDRVLGVIIGIPTLGILVVAGLDRRFGWTPEYALAIYLAALAVAALGQCLFSWAMASNKFFSRAVRIQTDRGHFVESGGPYRYVRHPGYVGMIASMLAAPLALGSLWALVPASIVSGAYVVRTALEDRTLQEELEGYKDYAQHVRYRLVPGVW